MCEKELNIKLFLFPPYKKSKYLMYKYLIYKLKKNASELYACMLRGFPESKNTIVKRGLCASPRVKRRKASR